MGNLDVVQSETDGSVRVIKINRPQKRNSVNQDTAIALFRAFEQFEQDDSLSVAVLAGNGRSFCAGADLKALSTGDKTPDIGQAKMNSLAPMGPTRLQLSKPVIAAIEGYAVAGGMELALWCDLRVIASDATFGIFCRRFGVPLVDLGTVRLPRLIGESRALDLILTGRPVEAKEALEIGLANRVVPAGKALNEAISLAHKIASFPQTCLRNDRLSVLNQWNLSKEEAMCQELRHGRNTAKSGEVHSGASQFSGGVGRHGTFS